ncbi:MAG: type II secretion system F family protein [Verrucomicrobiia bacterium]
MQFEYRAYNSNCEIVTGWMEGASDNEVIEKLGDKDLMIVELRQTRHRPSRPHIGKIKVPLPVVTSFSRQLATMLRAGLPLARCLGSLGRQTSHRDMQVVMRELTRVVEGGASFSEALQLYPSVFSNVYIGMVKAGETGGLLAEVLDRMAGYLEMTLQLRQRVRSAMMYPVIVSILGVGICVFMVTKIVPVFVDIFKEFHRDLPLPTLILISVSDWVCAHLLSCLIAVLATILAWRSLLRTPAGALFWDRLKLRLPVTGSLATKIAFSRFAHTLGSMLHSGVPVLKALNIAATAVSNVELEAVVRHVGDLIESGDTMHDAMVKQGKFPSMMLEMIAAGEETGTVDELLARVAEHYDQEIDAALDGLTAMLEPLLILFLGVVVGGVVVAMFLPIFRMTEAVQF